MVGVITAYVKGHKEIFVLFWPGNMNRNASALGRLAKGKPKKYGPAEIKRRTALLKKARSKRWKKEALEANLF
jgi:hypothetical protein